MDDNAVMTMSKALQDANASYRGNEHNLHAFWRHLARAALAAAETIAQPPDTPPLAARVRTLEEALRSSIARLCVGCARGLPFNDNGTHRVELRQLSQQTGQTVYGGDSCRAIPERAALAQPPATPDGAK